MRTAVTNKEILITLVDLINQSGKGNGKSVLYDWYQNEWITQFEFKKMKYMIDLRNHLCHGGMLEEDVTDHDLLFIAKVLVKVSKVPSIYRNLSAQERSRVSDPVMIVAKLKIL